MSTGQVLDPVSDATCALDGLELTATAGLTLTEARKSHPSPENTTNFTLQPQLQAQKEKLLLVYLRLRRYHGELLLDVSRA